MAGHHIRRQRLEHAGGAAGAEQPVQPVIAHHINLNRNQNNLIRQWLQVVTLGKGAAATTGLWVRYHLASLLEWIRRRLAS